MKNVRGCRPAPRQAAAVTLVGLSRVTLPGLTAGALGPVVSLNTHSSSSSSSSSSSFSFSYDLTSFSLGVRLNLLKKSTTGALI